MVLMTRLLTNNEEIVSIFINTTLNANEKRNISITQPHQMLCLTCKTF